MRGRKPDPAGIKKAKGNPGRRPYDDDDGKSGSGGASAAADVEPSISNPPDWLDTSDLGTPAAIAISQQAIGIWRRMHPELTKLKILKNTDEFTFGRYCRYFAEWVSYTRLIDLEGSTYETKSEFAGTLKRPHPAVRFRKEVEQSLRELGLEMGLTPSSRQRMFSLMSSKNQPGLPLDPGAPGNTPKKPAMPAGDSPIGLLN